MAKQKNTDQGSGAGEIPAQAPNTQPAAGTAVVPPPPKLRRRPLVALTGLALVVLGALGAAWVYLATSQTSEVLVMRSTVMRGEVIGPEDLAVAQVGADPAVQVVPGDQLGQMVGKRAALDLAAGSLLSTAAVTEVLVPAGGQSVVGVALTPALMPGEPLLPGDSVRVVMTSGGQNDPAELDGTVLAQAEVVSVTTPSLEMGGQGAVVSLLVAEGQAPTVAQYAASSRVALVLDSRED